MAGKSFRRVSSLIAAGLMAFSLSACSQDSSSEMSQPDQETASESVSSLNVLCPSGAPALATLGLYDLEGISVDYVQGQDTLSAELAKKDSEYDIIVAPINLGVMSYQSNEAWQLESVLTWGNLYVIGQPDWDTPESTLSAFGQGAVPGLVFNNLFEDVQAQISWEPSVAEAAQIYLAQEDTAALLAQPQASITIQKAGELDRESEIVADLQELWQQKYDTAKKGYPQAALFVQDLDAQSLTEIMNAINSFLGLDDEQKGERIEAIGPEKLGVPSAAIALSTWQSQNIDNVPAIEVKGDIETFLAVFNISFDEKILAG